jgi:hypothetical protein
MTLAIAPPPKPARRGHMTAAEFQQRYERKTGMTTSTTSTTSSSTNNRSQHDPASASATAPAPATDIAPAPSKGSGTGTIIMNRPKRRKITKPVLTVKTGDMGSMERVHKDAILIDRSYQRDQNTHKVQAIAADWSYAAAGAIIVARRGPDLYAVEGAHRVLAARLRPDVEFLNCIVFQTEDEKDESAVFLITNTNRRPLTAIERFKAQIKAGDEAVQFADTLLAEAGYKISSKPVAGTRSTKSVGTIVRALRLDRDVFLSVWPLILELADGGPIHSRIIDTLFYIERRLVGTSASLTRGVWRERIMKLGADAIIRETAAAAAYHQSNSDAIWARGLIECMNRGMRSNRLVLPEEAAEQARCKAYTATLSPTSGSTAITDSKPAFETYRNAGGNRVPPGVCCQTCDQELTDLPHYVKRVAEPGESESRDYWCAACNPGIVGDGRGVPA